MMWQIILKHITKLFFSFLKVGFVYPKCIIGIKGNGFILFFILIRNFQVQNSETKSIQKRTFVLTKYVAYPSVILAYMAQLYEEQQRKEDIIVKHLKRK